MQGGRAHPVRVMMIGPYPRVPGQLNGGVAAALMYLSEALVEMGGVELIGVRISKNDSDVCESARFSWVLQDLPLGRLSLTTLYARQRRRLAELVDKYQPDVLHAQGTDISGYLAVRSSVPAVVTVHGLLAECARFQSNRTERWRATLAAAVTERGTVVRATDLIAISPYVTHYYADGIRGQVHDIPNAVAPGFFGVIRNPEAGRFLYAGRIANGKGLVDLIKAYARVRRAHWSLILAGATPDMAYERHLREQAGICGVSGSVHFRGLLNEAALLDEFSSAHALVLPSLQETAPMVIQQAMAAGLPVIATRVGGIPFQVEHESTGLLLDPGDVETLGSHLESIEMQPDRSRALGETAKSTAEKNFRAVVVAEATAGVYRDMLSRPG